MARVVLLDIDGTLVDSNDLHAEAWCEALAAQGFDADYAVVRSLIGMGGDQIVPRLTGLDAESAPAKALLELRTKLFQEHKLPRVLPFPGARALLEALISRGYGLVVATSAKDEELAGLLARGDLQDLLPQRTTSDDAERSKPAPDIVHAALERAGCAAEQALMLGDTPYDAEAAKHAGVPFVGLTCGGHAASRLMDAVAVYRDPADLLASLASSVFRTPPVL